MNFWDKLPFGNKPTESRNAYDLEFNHQFIDTVKYEANPTYDTKEQHNQINNTIIK